jgi:CO/xanthine dehydrogenase Mo-binding subunit
MLPGKEGRNKMLKYVGKSEKRVDGVKKVTGYVRYTDDLKLSGMLYARIKKSPYPHAKILRIDGGFFNRSRL